MTFREASDRWSKLYNKFFGCDSNKVLEYGNSHNDLKSAKKMIMEAKAYAADPLENKDKELAYLFCFKIIEPMALKNFWAFLGPNKKSQKIRIDNGDFDVYLSIVYETMPKILKSFKPNYDSVESLAKGLQWWSRGYLKEAGVVENHNRAKAGDEDFNTGIVPKSKITKMVRPANVDDLRGWEKISGTYQVDDSDLEIEDKWIALSKDPIFDSDKGVAKHNWRNIMAMALNGDKIEDIAEANNISSNSLIRNGLFCTNFSVDWSKFDPELGNKGLVQGLCNKYDISMEDFAKLLKTDPDFVVGTLQKQNQANK